jgi:hypothetical protein
MTDMLIPRIIADAKPGTRDSEEPFLRIAGDSRETRKLLELAEETDNNSIGAAAPRKFRLSADDFFLTFSFSSASEEIDGASRHFPRGLSAASLS